MRYEHWLGLGASIFLGIIFCISGLGKLLGPAESFETFLAAYPNFLTLEQTKLLLFWLPYVELAIGSLLIVGVATKLIAALSTLLVAAFTINNVWFISHGMGYKPCGCLGIVDRIMQSNFSTQQSLYLDIAMLGLILIILLCYKRNFTNIYPWFLKKN